MELKLYYLGEVSRMTKEQVEEAEKFIKGFEYGIIRLIPQSIRAMIC